MRPPFSTRLGKLLLELREEAEMPQDYLAYWLHVSVSTIQDWEEGRSEPPDDLEFYYRLRQVPWLSQIEVTEIKNERFQGTLSRVGRLIGESGAILERRIQELEEADRNPPRSFTEMGHHAMMPGPDLSLLADLVSNLVQPEAQPVRIHYSHTMPEHAPDLVDEGNWQQEPKKGVAYERPRSQYDSQYLRENAERLTERFLNALRNPDDALNPAAQHGLHVFAETMAQTEGTSLSQAASEHNLPFSSLAGWVRRRLVPILYRDKHTVYLAKETAQNVADLHQKAKEQGIPTGKLLRRNIGKAGSVSPTDK